MNKSSKLSGIVMSALFAALLSVSALVYIPFTVPITLQTLVLFSSLFIIGGKRTSLSVLIYVVIGAIGLPVFSGFSGGIARLFDATGGYVFGMLIGSVLYALFEKILPHKISFMIFSAILTLASIYCVGTLWYAFIYLSGEKSIAAVILTTVVPFIIPDTIKLVLSAFIAKRVRAFKRIN